VHGSVSLSEMSSAAMNMVKDASLSRGRARSAVAVLRSTHPNAAFKIAGRGDKVIKQCVNASNKMRDHSAHPMIPV
jgi:hypothetical protein